MLLAFVTLILGLMDTKVFIKFSVSFGEISNGIVLLSTYLK